MLARDSFLWVLFFVVVASWRGGSVKHSKFIAYEKSALRWLFSLSLMTFSRFDIEQHFSLFMHTHQTGRVTQFSHSAFGSCLWFVNSSENLSRVVLNDYRSPSPRTSDALNFSYLLFISTPHQHFTRTINKYFLFYWYVLSLNFPSHSFQHKSGIHLQLSIS